MNTATLQKITQEELDNLIETHRQWLEEYAETRKRPQRPLVSLKGMDASGLSFVDADLRYLNLSVSKFDGCVFDNCNMAKVHAGKTSFQAASFRYANVYAFDGIGAMFDHADFTRANLTLSNFYKAMFFQAKFINTRADAASFFKASFNEAQFSRCTFTNSNFVRASFGPRPPVRDLATCEGLERLVQSLENRYEEM